MQPTKKREKLTMAKAIEWVVGKFVWKKSEYTRIECTKASGKIITSLIRAVAGYNMWLSVIGMHLANHFARIQGKNN